MLAARIPTLPAAVAPVVVGTAAAAHAGAVYPLAATGALVVALAIQVGTNLANDALDFLRGADGATRRGPLRVTHGGLLAARQVLTGAYLCFAVAALVGLLFVRLYGWPVLAAGVLAIAAGLAYTAGPWPLAYHGLGELFVFIFFGVVAVVGTAYVQLGRVDSVAVVTSVPVGLLVTAILVVNNLRDIETDRAAGKWTLAVRLGAGWTRALYVVCAAGVVATPVMLWAAGAGGSWFWLPWLALPVAVPLTWAVVTRSDGPTLNYALRRTAQLHLLFSALLGAALLWR